LETTLGATGNALTVADQSLTQASQVILTLGSTIDTTSKTVNDSIPMMDTLGNVITQQLPTTIETAQTSLQAAQSSARVVDSTLSLITAIPFISNQQYQPEAPGRFSG
jgi:hypothetical protein